VRWLLLALMVSTAFADTTLPESGPHVLVGWKSARQVIVSGANFPPDELVRVSINEYHDEGFQACGRDYDESEVAVRPDARGRFTVKLRVPTCARRACKPGELRLAAHAAFACGLDCSHGVVERFACPTDSL